MILKTQLTGVFLCLVFTTLLSQNFYIADNAPTSLSFSEKGAFKLSLIPPFSNRANFHLGYSPLKQFFISTGFLRSSSKENTEFSTIEVKGRSYTGSIGTFYSLKNPFFKNSKINKNNDLIFDLQIGYSAGNVLNDIDEYFSADLDFQTTFIKLGVNQKYEYFEVGTYYKYNKVKYLGGEVIGGSFYPDLFEAAANLDQQNGYNLHELLTQVSVGLTELKFFFGSSISLNDKNGQIFSSKDSGYLGLVFEIDAIANWIKK